MTFYSELFNPRNNAFYGNTITPKLICIGHVVQSRNSQKILTSLQVVIKNSTRT